MNFYPLTLWRACFCPALHERSGGEVGAKWGRSGMETRRWHSLMPVRIFTLSFDAERELFQAEFFAWQGKA